MWRNVETGEFIMLSAKLSILLLPTHGLSTYNYNNFIPFFTSYNQFMYNVKNMAQPPDEPAGVAENGGQFAISRETDKAASC